MQIQIKLIGVLTFLKNWRTKSVSRLMKSSAGSILDRPWPYWVSSDCPHLGVLRLSFLVLSWSGLVSQSRDARRKISSLVVTVAHKGMRYQVISSARHNPHCPASSSSSSPFTICAHSCAFRKGANNVSQANKEIS